MIWDDSTGAIHMILEWEGRHIRPRLHVLDFKVLAVDRCAYRLF